MAESEEELKSLLMKEKERSEKAGSKLNIQKTKTMASSPITSWQKEEEKVENKQNATQMNSGDEGFPMMGPAGEERLWRGRLWKGSRQSPPVR